jgi:hypothetical protein
MSVATYGFWLIFGLILAYLFLLTQRWSVRIISPHKPKLSKLLIIGGAVLRWVLIFLALLWALSSSIMAMFLVFTVFMISRLIILFKWQGLLFTKWDRFTHVE